MKEKGAKPDATNARTRYYRNVQPYEVMGFLNVEHLTSWSPSCNNDFKADNIV